jgi:hypothetical protein
MTRTFATDSTNDLYIGETDTLVLVEGVEAVKFAAEQAVRTLLGEMVLAADQGLPYFEALWTGTPNLQRFEAALRQTILAVADVRSILTLDITIAGQNVRYVAEILTSYGPVALNG